MKMLRIVFLASFLALMPLVGFAAEININSADLASLQQLQGVGPAKAQAIVDYREANGPFTTVDDLSAVSGIGPRTVELNRERIRVSD